MNHESGPGVRPSPNIWNHPEVYEIENRAVDRRGVIEMAMSEILGRPTGWGHVLDIGCGAGFHLPGFARRADRVTGVEPHPPLVELARRRVEALPGEDVTGPGSDDGRRVSVLEGSAEAIPVESGSVDVAHARWAYFFGPGCEPGLAELERVMAPGGTAFVVDNDASTSTFGAWFTRAHPAYDPDAVTRFWRRHGWTTRPLLVAWEADTREDFEAIVRIEFAPALADAILAEHAGTSVDYAVALRWRRD